MKKMRTLIGIVAALGFILSACNEEVGLDQLSAQDEETLIALQQEQSSAVVYNDSLASYINLTGINNDAQCQYFDEHYHTHDSLYTTHHNNYSHSYGWDDHTMGNGGMMSPRNGMTGNFPNGMGHYQSDHNFMDSLHIAHEPYHFSGN